MSVLNYPALIEPLPAADGGGFVALISDLPGCMSDGTPPEQAVTNVRDAVDTWIEAANDLGDAVPPPSRHFDLDAAQ